VQRVEPDEIGAQRTGQPDHFEEVFEVSDPPIAPRPQFVKLQTDPPKAPLFENIRQIASGDGFRLLLFLRPLNRFFIYAQRSENFPLGVVGDRHFYIVGGRPCQADAVLFGQTVEMRIHSGLTFMPDRLTSGPNRTDA
jgi:hypothetical protein